MISPQSIRIMLVDDHSTIHQLVLKTLEKLPDIVLVAQCHNGQEAIAICEEQSTTIDVILMDIIMPHLDGIEATREIHRRYPDIKIVALSSFQEDENIRAMIESGASGYILKSALTRDLTNTIRTIKEGKAVFSYEVLQALMSHESNPKKFNLTDRELEILRRLANGDINNKIASDLNISNSTVKFHINNIQLKMAVKTRIEAIALAVRFNMI
jgi:DNA-binding NarL/FixJ family response regulator